MKKWKLIRMMLLIPYGLIVGSYAFGAEPLTVYSVSEEREHEIWVPLFKQEAGLDVKFLHLTGGILWTRVMAEGKAGKIRADIAMNTHDFSLAAKNDEIFFSCEFLIYLHGKHDNCKCCNISYLTRRKFGFTENS